MPAAPGQTTLAILRAAAARRADQPAPTADTYIATVEWNEWIDGSRRELYDLLIQKYGNDWFVADPWSFTTDGTSERYALPTDIYKVLGVDLQLTGVDGGWTALKRFSMQERNRSVLPNVQTRIWGTNLRYRLSGNSIWLSPRADSGQVLRIWYAPRPLPLADSGTITLSGMVAGDTVTVAGVVFTAVAAGATGNQFNVGGTDSITATNLAAAIEGSASAAMAGVSATASGAVVTVLLDKGTDITAWSASGHATFDPDTGWSSTVDGVSGWEEYIVVDAVIKAKQKQEEDVSAWLAQKSALVRRIEEAAESRDAGAPATVADSRGMEDLFPMMRGSGGVW